MKKIVRGNDFTQRIRKETAEAYIRYMARSSL